MTISGWIVAACSLWADSPTGVRVSGRQRANAAILLAYEQLKIHPRFDSKGFHPVTLTRNTSLAEPKDSPQSNQIGGMRYLTKP
jgi:hypothetical protein